MTDTALDARMDRATAAYLRTFEGPWGLKASSEDALLSILSELYPDDFQNSAEGIYKIRGSAELSRLADVLWEDLECEGLEAFEIAREIIPMIDAVMEAQR